MERVERVKGRIKLDSFVIIIFFKGPQVKDKRTVHLHAAVELLHIQMNYKSTSNTRKVLDLRCRPQKWTTAPTGLKTRGRIPRIPR